MKSLLLSADDIQNFSKFIYDQKTAAAQLINVGAIGGNLNLPTSATAPQTAVLGDNINQATNSLVNSNNNLAFISNNNTMSLQYILKHQQQQMLQQQQQHLNNSYRNLNPTSSAVTTSSVPASSTVVSSMSHIQIPSTNHIPHLAQTQQPPHQQYLQQQQQQMLSSTNIGGGSTTIVIPSTHLSHQHQAQQIPPQQSQQQAQRSHQQQQLTHQQQQQQLLAQSQSQLKQLQLKQPTIHQQHSANYHHHPYFPGSIQQTSQSGQQQNSLHHQQAQSHLLNSLNNSLFNSSTLIGSTTTGASGNGGNHITTATATATSGGVGAAGTTTGSVTYKTSIPIHALNQNSNFSAASSSTGGGTISSHAPTQQSNGSSLSPPNRHPHNTAAAQKAQAIKNGSSGAAATAAANAANQALTRVTSNTQCAKKIKNEPILSQYHQQERLSFAKNFIPWNEDHWRRVVFQDERKFNLDGPDGFSYYFHDLRNYERTLSQRPRGNSVYIYIILCSSGPIHLEISSAKFRLESCIETILKQRQNIVDKLGGNADFVLQDHNWTTNCLPNVQEWFNMERLKTQKWPTIAHDLNIMENIWGWLIREVFDGGRKFSRKDDLVNRIKEAWSRLPMDLVTNLYSTLPERITELYYTRGIYTNC